MHILKLVKANLLDEALYARVDRSHIAMNHGVVGVLFVTQMNEAAADVSQSEQQ